MHRRKFFSDQTRRCPPPWRRLASRVPARWSAVPTKLDAAVRSQGRSGACAVGRAGPWSRRTPCGVARGSPPSGSGHVPALKVIVLAVARMQEHSCCCTCSLSRSSTCSLSASCRDKNARRAARRSVPVLYSPEARSSARFSGVWVRARLNVRILRGPHGSRVIGIPLRMSSCAFSKIRLGASIELLLAVSGTGSPSGCGADSLKSVQHTIRCGTCCSWHRPHRTSDPVHTPCGAGGRMSSGGHVSPRCA